MFTFFFPFFFSFPPSKATPFTESRARGQAGVARTLRLIFLPADKPRAPAITGFAVVNASSDLVVPGFENVTGAQLVVGPPDVSTPLPFTLVALVDPGFSGSVRFFVNGVAKRTENEPPFALAGDTSSSDKAKQKKRIKIRKKREMQKYEAGFGGNGSGVLTQAFQMAISGSFFEQAPLVSNLKSR